MKKVKVGIIGTGNIVTDILVKIMRSDYLECGIFAGRNPDSEGIRFAEKLGVKTSFGSIQAIEENPESCDIVFDATSAETHRYHAPILKKLNKFVIDMTPAHIGPFCIPVLNLDKCLENETNVNLITCGGQATVPIAEAITRVHPETSYIEVVATIASKSAGIGTRNNIDEFTQTTKDAILEFSHVPEAKAIIILNPAEPPVKMRNTIYALIDNPDIDRLNNEISKVVGKICKYVPGYKIIVGPILENGRVTTTIEVTGQGDYLPSYAGNLDIITCAGVEIAEKYAMKHMERGL